MTNLEHRGIFFEEYCEGGSGGRLYFSRENGLKIQAIGDQITQWYPKPAVYDKNGWHQMPYLTQGEFYSEYGSFDVKITLPENYIVGATGDLITESEITFCLYNFSCLLNSNFDLKY